METEKVASEKYSPVPLLGKHNVKCYVLFQENK